MTTEPPDSLPEGWVGKPKEDYYSNRRTGCSSLVALGLLFVMFAVVVGVAALLIYDPTLLDKILNYPNLPQTQQALDLTAQFNAQQATQFAAESLATRNALATQQAHLSQAGTQAANEVIATQTAVAVERAQLATQAAFNLQGTQAALNLYATQIQSTLEQQHFQVQLAQTATQLAIIFEATQVQLEVAFTATYAAVEQFATATAAALSGQPVFTPTPAAQP
jgi:hypothetical protein